MVFVELSFEQFTRQFDSTLEPIICYSAERQEGRVYPQSLVDRKWKSPLEPLAANSVPSRPLIMGVNPTGIDTAVFRAMGSYVGAQKIGTYIIPNSSGSLPSVYLLAREPKELLGRHGWLQLVEGLSFEYLNSDPKGFPCNFFCDDECGVEIIGQTRVGAERLQRPVARIPREIEYSDALMNTDCIVEEDDTLLVSYADGREPQEFELFHLNQ